MAPLETHELASLAPANGNGFYENHDARISKVSIQEYHDEGSDDGREGESASAALLGGHTRSNSLGIPDPPVEARQVIKAIISETAPTLFLTVLGMMFTGALLQRVTHWKPMRAVDELFILIPMLNNLKGNLELVLSARLATASHIGSGFVHTAVASGSTGEKVGGDGKGTRRWHIGKVVRELVKQAPHKAPKIKDEGTTSGWREFIIVIATAMSSACLSGLILGSFMCSIVILCRKFKLDPDNIAPPIASCLGDLVTLTLTALTSTLFFYTSGRPQDPPRPTTPQNTTSAFLSIRDTQPASGHFPFLPFLATLGLIVLIPFVFQLCRHLTFSRPLVRDGWSPLVVAMAIESGTGLVLDCKRAKMSGWMSYFTGKKDTRQTARDAIVNTRQHLAVLDKKEENLQRKIDEELKKAKANAVNNKTAATAALRRKKLNAIENANLNAETMAAMKQGAQALRDIHGNLTIDKVDSTMDQVREQMELTEEISQAISNPLNVGVDLDEDELKDELAELEQEELNDRLMGADRAPVHTPAVTTGPSTVSAGRSKAEEEDAEERELRELQAALAM
ncbi:unnamed protein product [Rhizoctonia solani]|uniref:SLC41A/MgtE integral membrane domain-containing protein n=1 Tax=Rhizoctonia solani TaxID=456999 RepID=A0A8H3A0I5_9AGAM|nr:unnamed protein product [Rhizoctonia solani]